MITAATVANASQLQLLCLTYELFLEDIQEALACEGKDRKKAVEHGKGILIELVEGLDFRQQIAKDLFRLYIYIQNSLINAWEEDDKLREIYRLMHTIYEGYSYLLDQDEIRKPAMANVEPIYAGITYGKACLSEIVMGNEQRGFKA